MRLLLKAIVLGLLGLEWRGINMAEGKLTIFVCTGRIKSDCKRLWTQRIK